MTKRLLGGLGVLGLALAGAVVRGIFDRGLNALGAIGVVIGLGLFVLLMVLAANTSSPGNPEPPDPPSTPTDPVE